METAGGREGRGRDQPLVHRWRLPGEGGRGRDQPLVHRWRLPGEGGRGRDQPLGHRWRLPGGGGRMVMCTCGGVKIFSRSVTVSIIRYGMFDDSRDRLGMYSDNTSTLEVPRCAPNQSVQPKIELCWCSDCIIKNMQRPQPTSLFTVKVAARIGKTIRTTKLSKAQS